MCAEMSVFPMTLDMDKICRVCMKSEVELYLIFDEKYAVDRTSLAGILTECTMYKVNRYDELPHQICMNCMELAKSAFSFKRNCEKSYRMLIGILEESNGDNHNTTSSHIKQEPDSLQAVKSTQTEDSSLYPCERCEQKFFTFDALRVHRENEHKGSAIVCRFCSKTFNRVGYLKTHIAVFHPESGYTSHNQCNICKRQFTRREHMRRHLAVIHKIVEIIDAPELTEDETSKSEPLETLEEAKIQEHHCGSIFEQECADKNNSSPTATTNGETYFNYSSQSEDDVERIGDDEKPALTEDEDEKPLSNFIGLPSKSFVEVLIDEAENDDPVTTLAFNNIKSELVASPTNILAIDALDVQQSQSPARSQKTDCASSADEEKEYKCATCDKVFQRQETLQRHLAKHTQEKSFLCTVCGKSFTRANFLKNHMKNTHDAAAARSLKCDECDIEFTHITQLKRHKETKHSTKSHTCELCQKSFTTKLYMQRHMVSHGKKRFVCKECSERFLTKDELNAHIKAENHDKPLLCPECGLRCKTNNILMVHMRRHKGEKPFKCKFCSKGFPRMDDLRIHEKYHTGEKSHFCETCGKGFQRKYNLTIHMRVHTGEKPYKCPHCPHAFTQSNDLKSHIRRHTGERFRCEICGAPFLQGYQMRQHKLAEHGVKENPPTQRVEKYTSPEEQEQQIKQNLQRELAKTMDFTADPALDATLTNLDEVCNNTSLEPPAVLEKEIHFLNI